MAFLGRQPLAKVAPNHPFAKPQIGFVPKASTSSSAGAVSKIVASSSKLLPAMTDATDYLGSLKANAEHDGMTEWAGQLGKALELAPQAKSVQQFVKMLAMRGL